MKIGYMRVSSESDRQNTDLQRDALTSAKKLKSTWLSAHKKQRRL